MTSEHQQDQHEGAQALAPETGRATATAGETAAEAVRETGTAAAPDAAPTVNGQITEGARSQHALSPPAPAHTRRRGVAVRPPDPPLGPRGAEPVRLTPSPHPPPVR